MLSQDPRLRNMIDADDPRVSKFGHPAPPWLVNYADLMTELVCFFIILYALSAVFNQNVRRAKREIDQIIKEEKLVAETRLTKEGVRVTLEEKGTDAYFEVGKADLTPKMMHVLSKMGPVFKKINNEILIEGHTDNLPISSDQYPSNWELSSARAATVLHHLIDQYGIEPTRISAVGYGEFRPRVPNDTPEDRAHNRRVVFFIKNSPPKPEILDWKIARDREQDLKPTVPASEVPRLIESGWPKPKTQTPEPQKQSSSPQAASPSLFDFFKKEKKK
jgi:chemotaxis protein MotB